MKQTLLAITGAALALSLMSATAYAEPRDHRGNRDQVERRNDDGRFDASTGEDSASAISPISSVSSASVIRPPNSVSSSRDGVQGATIGAAGEIPIGRVFPT
jgi:hypothetical protein